jgi:peroxiredoxin
MPLFLVSCFGVVAEKTGKEGQEMPDFNILLTDNTVLNTRNLSAGKPIVLFYISPYCPYCNKQTKDILSEMGDFSDIQFLFITSYPLEEIEKFKKGYNLSKYPNITVGVDTAHFIHDYFGAEGVPYTAVYNKNKKLNKTFLGPLTVRQLAKVLDE